MAKQTINLGSGPDSYTGDSLNVAFTKINENFTDLYSGNAAGNIRTSGNIIANTSLRTDGFIRGQSLEITANAVVLGTISANNFTYANGVAIGNFSSSNINTSGNISGNTITANSFAGIGNFTDVTITGNLQVNGSTTYIDVTRTSVKDPLMEIGGNSSGGALTSDDSKDRGLILHYYNGAARDAFLGWDASSSEFRIASNAIVVNNEVLLYDTYANVRAGYFIGNGSQLTGITSYANSNVVAYASAGWAGNIIPNANAVYSLGNVTNQWANLWVANNTIYIGGVPIGITAGNVLTINGNPILSSNSNANVSTLGTISANNFVGDGSLLTNVASTGNLLIEGTSIAFDADAADNPGTVLNISPSGEGWAYLQLPNDVTANTANVRLWNAAGNVEIGAGDFSNNSDSHQWNFTKDGNLILPQGGTITEGIVTSNPTIQLTPANPDVASQKLVIKGGGSYVYTDNGIEINYYVNTAQVGDNLIFYVYSDTYADQTLYWWIYPEGAGIGDSNSGTVVLTGSSGQINILIDSDDYEFTVRVSPENNNYDPANVGVESGLINASAPTFGAEHHLHLTTGNLEVTSIFLGTDDHNVRTTTDGNIQITTPNEGNQVWTFGTDGDLTFPRDLTGNSDPYLTITGGANPGITATDVSLAGPANLAISSDYTTFSGFTGNRVQIYSDNGEILGDANLVLTTNNANTGNTAQWTFGADGTTQFPGSKILAPVSESITMQSDQYSQLMWENANLTVAPNMAINSNFYVSQNNATLDIAKRDGSGTQLTKSWYWNADGTLTLPAGGVIAEGGGISGAIRLTPSGGANDNQALLIYPTAGAPEGDHIHLTAGGGSTELYLGNDFHYVKLVDGGNIELRAATANLSSQAAWTFDTTGNVDTIQALGIKIPDGVPSNVAIINSTTGSWEANPRSNLATTGGTGTGLIVNVAEVGGYASTIEIATAGTGYTNGDLITVTSGSSNATFTIVIAGRNSWRFGIDGTLITPSNLVIGPGPGSGSSILQYNDTLQIVGEGANSAVIFGWAANQSAPDSVATIAMNYPSGGEGNVLIAAGNNATTVNYWLFDNSGNLTLPGNIISDTGDVISNNVFVTGSIQPASFASPAPSMSGFDSISAANITANYFIGNGSQLTGITAGSNYGNSNVTSLLASLGSNAISTTGNITGGNISGNISITGNVTGTSTNVTLVAGSYNWTFNNAGNLVLPGNTFSINYANGAAVSLGSGGVGNYGDSNVVSLLSSFGSNTITTTGNVTGGILISNGTIIGNPDIILGNTANASATKTRIVTDTTFSYIQTGNGTPGTTGNIVFAPYASATQKVVVDTSSGNISTIGNTVFTTNNGSIVFNTGSYITGSAGGVSVGGNIYVSGGNATTGNNSIVAGATNTLLANSTASFTANVNSYAQITYQNKNSGVDATADLVLTADNGSDVTNYSDLGIINSGYDNATPTNSLGNIVYAADTYLYAQGNLSNTSQSGGNLVIGTTTASKNVKIFAGGNTAAALVANISNVGVSIAGSLTTTGNITTANITGTSANVTITANNYVSTFDTTGLVTLPGNLTVNGSGGIKTPNLPAFRVTGKGGQISSTTQLTSTHWDVDFNQGSHLDGTSGYFTAPVAGLYQVNLVVRTYTNSGGSAQTVIEKNDSTVQIMVEWAANTTMNHTGGSSVVKLAVGDTLRFRVLMGSISFDLNDNWSVAFLG